MKDKLKSEKGITLTTLVIYIIVLVVALGILATVSTFFYKNVVLIKDSAQYAAEFDKFNASFIKDIKNNSEANVDQNAKTIVFEDGTTYVYSENDKGIYRNQVKIATHVDVFNTSTKTISVNNVDKQIISVNIVIGNSKKTLINKSIDYTLKYW
jgi:type II secretory pathway pseudopilin PulG